MHGIEKYAQNKTLIIMTNRIEYLSLKNYKVKSCIVRLEVPFYNSRNFKASIQFHSIAYVEKMYQSNSNATQPTACICAQAAKKIFYVPCK